MHINSKLFEAFINYGQFCNFGWTLFVGFNAKILDFAGNGNYIQQQSTNISLFLFPTKIIQLFILKTANVIFRKLKVYCHDQISN